MPLSLEGLSSYESSGVVYDDSDDDEFEMSFALDSCCFVLFCVVELFFGLFVELFVPTIRGD